MNIHLYSSPDDLPVDLRRYVRSGAGSQLLVFHHPYLVEIFPFGLADRIENVLELRRTHAEKNLDEGLLSGFIFSHQRPYRLSALLSLVKRDGMFPDDRAAIRFWRLAASVWMDAEESEDSPIWSYLLAAPVPLREAMTTSFDRRAWRALPDVVTIYRGLQAGDEESARDALCAGWSWSLSEKVARFFSRRYIASSDLPWIARTQVPREAILAYLTRRNEAEVLVSPDVIDPCLVSLSQLSDQAGCDDMVSLKDFAT